MRLSASSAALMMAQVEYYPTTSDNVPLDINQSDQAEEYDYNDNAFGKDEERETTLFPSPRSPRISQSLAQLGYYARSMKAFEGCFLQGKYILLPSSPV